MNQFETGLLGAVNEAVRRGRRELDQLGNSVETVLLQLTDAATTSVGESNQLLADLSEFTDAFGNDLHRHLDAQRERLSTFNIAFFGRTGAGKSTLLSAFGQLDGSYVSPGDSDWTTDVTEIEWQGCSLWDTPGINGWGRTRKRAELEETARRAVEIADVVLLCFDTQSQQASEFGKVAQWVKAYGKPTVAVLNVRNLRWRHPAKVSSQSARRSLSRAVAEHANNIRTELSKIDLGGTPVVSIQSRRALFARATTPFQGPASSNFNSDREQFGTDYLAEWSNFSVLEDLIAASIAEGGAELRQTSLREGLRAIVDARVSDLAGRLKEIDPQIRVIENRIAQLFDTLGYLEGAARSRYLAADAGLISAVEHERSEPFTAALTGTFGRHFEQLLQSHLLQVRETTLRRADELVSKAIDDNVPLTDIDFQAAVYSTSDLQSATDKIWGATRLFLQREIELAVSELVPDLSDATTNSVSFDAISSAKARAGLALQSAGLAAGAASGVIAIPSVATIWNPVGWVGTSVAIGLGVSAQASKFAGSRLAKSGEDERATARADIERDARSAVHKTFDAIEDSLRERSAAETWEVAAPVLKELLEQSLAMRRGTAEIVRLIDVLECQSNGIAQTCAGTDVLERATRRVLSSRGAKSRSGAEVWLGENWFEQASAPSTQPPEIVAARYAVFATQMEREREHLKQWLTKAWHVTPRGSVDDWLTEVGDSVANDSELQLEVARVREAKQSKPAVVILGDYSAGKSSLVKRLLVEMSGRVPPDLGVRGSAATSSAHAYELDHIRLIDTPGFQSGRANHDELALDAAGSAALVLVVVHVNLLIGDVTLLESIVNGTEKTVAKAGRILFLINRSDELGVDPTSDPQDYLLLRRRKSDELIAALGSRGIVLDLSEVHALAGDPFGEVGNRLDITRNDFDSNREWDGVESVVRTLDSFSRKQSQAGRERAAVDVISNALLSHREELRINVTELDAESTDLGKAIQVIANGESDAELLETSMRNRLTQIVEPFANQARNQIRGAGNDEMAKLPEYTTAWLEDSELASELDRFSGEIERDIDSWFAEHSSTIGRQLKSVSLSRDASIELEEKFVGLARGVDTAKIVAGSANHTAKAAKTLGNRDAIYGIGKSLGVKFKPWGAVKAGSRVAKAAPILAAIGTAADAHAMYKDHKSVGEREASRRDAIAFVAKAVEKVESDFLEGTSSDGPVPALRERATVLAEHRIALQADEERVTDGLQVATTQIELLTGLLGRAAELFSQDGAVSE